ncbi:MAG: type II toxin-antitoxin system VapC family toxin [Propionibacteriaceae bacterium]|nr:type II toxin-antitoxin system VapC family toxin [Propionibacteriaceae bacterium]
MIVVDTTVLSEPLRPTPEARVVAWLSANQHQVGISSVTLGELWYGAERLPVGARRTRLLASLTRLVESAGDRLLPHRDAEARVYAALRARREASGRPISIEDAMIAAACLTHDAALATRNVKDFEQLPIEIINPWEVA